MKDAKLWLRTPIPELHVTFVAGIRVERLLVTKENRFLYSIGCMKDAGIKFESFQILYNFLTL